MNKMDLDMTPAEEVSEHKPRTPLSKTAAGFAVFVAPVLVLGGGIALFFAMGALAPKPEEKAGEVRAPAVQFATATARPTTISITVQGEARSRFESVLASQVAGRIVWASPAFAEGGAFNEGDPLVRVDPADYQLAVVRARAQVAQAEEALAREEAEGELARQDWEVLGRGEAPSPLAVREPQLAQARAGLAAARAQLSGAELDLARATVRAPFTGRLRARRANVGDFVSPGAAIAEVFSTDVVEIRVPLTDADLTALGAPLGFTSTAARPGPNAHVSAVAGGRIRTWEGRLVRTDATVDSRTRLVYGIVEVRDPFSARHTAPLAPGMFVTVHLESRGRETLVAAPRSALKRNEYVIVIGENNRIDLREVTPAQTTADEVLFRTGVADGERVVVSTLTSPREGMEVNPISRDAETPAAPAQQPTQQAPLDIRE